MLLRPKYELEASVEMPAIPHSNGPALVAYLFDAQKKAISLFAAIEPLIRPLGAEHGVRSHWHKRLIRSGPNTLRPSADNPPDRIIEADDILVVDLGPVLEAYDGDFERTYSRFHQSPDITGEQPYAIACEEAERDGWVFGADLAGHLVGVFPHERIPNDYIELYVKRGNKERMDEILEIHLHDRGERIWGVF
ncbi:hypothetical protein BDV12DRAFT_189604 [Aspergillus spectabilis]